MNNNEKLPHKSYTRPTEILNKATAALPNLSQAVNANYLWRDTQKINAEAWPPWCFIPHELWVETVRVALGEDYLKTKQGQKTLLAIIAAGTWRYGQGVYEFDPDILAAVAESDIPKNIPPNVLMRLPEWCIYVPTPGLKFVDHELYGFFAQLSREYDGTYQDKLQITVDTENGLSIYPIVLDGHGVIESVKTYFDEVVSYALAEGIESPQLSDKHTEALTHALTTIVSLLLYICADEPDISNRKYPDESPQRITPKRIKGIPKMFPAKAQRVWQVGQSIGDALRAAKAASGAGGGRMSPHLRRAHFQGYWTGKRGSERTYVLRWKSPIMVAGDRENVPDAPEE